MIPFDFSYYRPDSAGEAVALFQDLDAQGKKPLYYGGGTEIISMGRHNNVDTGAVIDIKSIPECGVQEFQDDSLVIGAGVTLTQIHEANLFPLLAQAGARVADHTTQNKITLGGNMCGSIVYRESLLPLLLTDCEVIIAGPGGNRNAPVNDIFDKQVQLNRGEVILQYRIPKSLVNSPHVHVKRTKSEKISYPLLTICALNSGQQVRFAFSGLCGYPFRSKEMEQALNDTSRPADERADHAISQLPEPMADNLESSAAYRQFVLKGSLVSILNELGG